MTDYVRANAIVRGRVQGVCFRMETQRAAVHYGVQGWVRNKSDGTVEAIFEGEKHQVDSILNWCRKGPSLSRVTGVDISWEDYLGEFTMFDITY